MMIDNADRPDDVPSLAARDVPSADPRLASGSEHRSDGDEVIALVEETARIDKSVVERRRVRVSTQTETRTETLHESLRGDAVGVTRVPIDRVIAEGEVAPQVRTEAGVTIIPVLEEVLVVEKRLVLKEEVHIQRTSSGEDVEVPVTLRRQRAVVEQVGLDGRPSQTEQTGTSKEALS